MADINVVSNGRFTVVAVPPSGVLNREAPTAEELNAGLKITKAGAWDSTDIPNATDSTDSDDRGWMDSATSTSGSQDAYSGAPSMFYPGDYGDVTDLLTQVWEAFRVDRPDYIFYVRILQNEYQVETPYAPGDIVSGYSFTVDNLVEDGESFDAVKYQVNLVANGWMIKNTLVAVTGAPTVSTPTITASVGDANLLEVTLGGKDITKGATYVSSDPTIASVSKGGVVTAKSVGTAEITVSHQSASAVATVTVTVS